MALVAAPDPATWIGRRDRTLLLVAVKTGLRSCELLGLRRADVILGTECVNDNETPGVMRLASKRM
jgi:integrase